MNFQESTQIKPEISTVGKLRRSTRNYLSWAFRHTVIPRRYKQAQFEWRWIRNFTRTFRHNLSDSGQRHLVSDAEELRTQGIIVRSVENIFDEDGLRALEEIRAIVENKLQDEKAQTAMKGVSDEAAMQMWKLLGGGQTIVEMPRIGALRGFVLSHMIHHRGQLSVYLRENDVPLPAIYGPSADEQM